MYQMIQLVLGAHILGGDSPLAHLPAGWRGPSFRLAATPFSKQPVELGEVLALDNLEIEIAWKLVGKDLRRGSHMRLIVVAEFPDSCPRL